MTEIANTLRILIVDDDQEQSELLARLLRKKIKPARLEIFFANSVEEGIRRSRDLIPCVVFLDLVFPNESGWEQTAARIPDFKGTVVVITNYDDQNVEMACRKCGATTVFPKSKLHGLIEMIVRVVSDIRLNNIARETMPVYGCV